MGEGAVAAISRLGRAVVEGVGALGYAGSLLFESIGYMLFGGRMGQRLRLRMVIEQMRQIGVDALPIVATLALTIGLMLAIQLISTLREFGAESQVILAVAVSVTREFGPLITGILVAGRSGSSLAARIGSMVVSQEVDALRVIGVEPVRYLVAPALIAMLIMLPALTLLADAVAIFGSALYSSSHLDLSISAYVVQSVEALGSRDLFEGLAKAAVFAVLICLVGTSSGFSVAGGAEGVGRATTRAVVWSISCIVIADMVFSYFLNR